MRVAEVKREVEAVAESLDSASTTYNMGIRAEKTKLMTNSANDIQMESKINVRRDYFQRDGMAQLHAWKTALSNKKLIRNFTCSLKNTSCDPVHRRKDYTIRVAAQVDKAAVLNICQDSQGGTDFLPAFYDNFITQKNGIGFVVLYQDKIIFSGFLAAQILDGGQSYCMKGARVHKEHKGNGIFPFLRAHTAEWAKSKDATKSVFTATDRNFHVMKPSFFLENNLVMTMGHNMYHLKTEHLNFEMLSRKETESVKLISFDEVAAFMCSKDISGYLFPHGRMMVDYVPYKLMQANAAVMKETSIYHTEAFSDVRSEEETVRGSLSFGTIFKVQRFSYVYNIEIYGNDQNSMRQHIIKHIMALKGKQIKGSICFMLLAEEGVSTYTVHETCIEYGLSRINCPEWVFQKVFVFESLDDEFRKYK